MFSLFNESRDSRELTTATHLYNSYSYYFPHVFFLKDFIFKQSLYPTWGSNL